MVCCVTNHVRETALSFAFEKQINTLSFTTIFFAEICTIDVNFSQLAQCLAWSAEN